MLPSSHLTVITQCNMQRHVFYFLETFTCGSDQGWSKSSDEPDATEVVRQRSAGVRNTQGKKNKIKYTLLEFSDETSI